MPEPRSFCKTPLGYSALIVKLSSKGLLFDEPDRVERHIKSIGYYRLMGYGLPFEQYSDDNKRLGVYRDGIEFDRLLNAYIVDRKLRILLLSAIERIEVAVRNTINHTMGCKYQSAHWFVDNSLFKESAKFKHADFLREIHRSSVKNADAGSEREKLREVFIHHYYKEYDTPEYPPAWMVAEVLSLGSWSKVYEHLSVSKDRKNISREYDLAPATMQSWLHSLTYLRNVCAHHGRLFGRKLPLPPNKAKNLPITGDNYLYSFVCVVWYMLKTISPSSSWLDEFHDELMKLSTDIKYFGFDANWLEHDFWLE
jgi:abortive infection bacteriophage resistance protein